MNTETQRAEIVTFEPVDLPASTALTPMAMVSQAVANGASLEMVSKLIDLQERVEKAQGRRAFDNAVAAAKGEIKPIVKDRVVDFTTQKGRTSYRHESFAAVADGVDQILHKHGLSYRHRASQDGGRLTVTCILAHRDGYSEETTLSAANDNSGNKNDIQSIGSAATYLQRYTLKLALGLATTDKDDDGKATSQEELPISGAATAAINSIDDCVTLADLTAWKEKNDPTVQQLDRNDADAVVRAWKARAREIREGAGQ
jgi:hypothetical protein